MSRYIPAHQCRTPLPLGRRPIAAISEECVMERNDDRNVDDLIDLGSVLEETKGASLAGSDTFNQRQPGGFGLEDDRSEEHTSELQSLMRISSAVFCLKKKNIISTT